MDAQAFDASLQLSSWPGVSYPTIGNLGGTGKKLGRHAEETSPNLQVLRQKCTAADDVFRGGKAVRQSLKF